eukprot:TRINITY_DN1162_c0_g1_i4.p1 TRINITY_DN1162_c0_g1~~TRINITY_DN1162_c0_g1_i4.p1  ORF type:complete len:907 (-),score=297.93 TRINITY_DN1162_c0_g1_i4:1074-3794(-)
MQAEQEDVAKNLAELSAQRQEEQSQMATAVAQRDAIRVAYEEALSQLNMLKKQIQQTATVSICAGCEQLRAECDVARQHYAEVEKSLREAEYAARAELSEVRVRLATEHVQVELFTDRAKRAAAERDSITKEVESLREQLSRISATATAGTTNQQYIKEEAEQLRQQVDTLQVQLQEAHEFEELHKEAEEEAARETSRLRASVDQLTTLLAEAQAKLAETAHNVQQRLQEQTEKAAANAEEQQQQIDALREKLRAAQDDATAAQEQLMRSTTEATKHEQHEQERQQQKEEDSDKQKQPQERAEADDLHLTVLTSEVESLRNQLQQERENLAVAKELAAAEVRVSEQQTSKFEKKWRRMLQQLSDALNEVAKHASALQKSNEVEALTRAQLNKQQAIEAELREKIGELEVGVKSLEDQLTMKASVEGSLRGQLCVAQTRSAEAARQLETAEESYKQRSYDLAEKERLLQSAEAELKQARALCADLTQQLAGVTERNSKYLEQLAELQSRNDGLQKQHNLLVSQLRVLTCRPQQQPACVGSGDETEADQSQVVEWLRNEKRLCECQKEFLQRTLDRERLERECTASELSRTAVELSALKQAYDGVPCRAECDEMRRRSSNAKEVTKAASAIVGANAAMEKEIKQLKEESAMLHSQLNSLKEAYERLSSEAEMSYQRYTTEAQTAQLWKRRTEALGKKYTGIEPEEYHTAVARATQLQEEVGRLTSQVEVLNKQVQVCQQQLKEAAGLQVGLQAELAQAKQETQQLREARIVKLHRLSDAAEKEKTRQQQEEERRKLAELLVEQQHAQAAKGAIALTATRASARAHSLFFFFFFFCTDLEETRFRVHSLEVQLHTVEAEKEKAIKETQVLMLKLRKASAYIKDLTAENKELKARPAGEYQPTVAQPSAH